MTAGNDPHAYIGHGTFLSVEKAQAHQLHYGCFLKSQVNLLRLLCAQQVERLANWHVIIRAMNRDDLPGAGRQRKAEASLSIHISTLIRLYILAWPHLCR